MTYFTRSATPPSDPLRTRAAPVSRRQSSPPSSRGAFPRAESSDPARCLPPSSLESCSSPQSVPAQSQSRFRHSQPSTQTLSASHGLAALPTPCEFQTRLCAALLHRTPRCTTPPLPERAPTTPISQKSTPQDALAAIPADRISTCPSS